MRPLNNRATRQLKSPRRSNTRGYAATVIGVRYANHISMLTTRYFVLVDPAVMQTNWPVGIVCQVDFLLDPSCGRVIEVKLQSRSALK